MKTFSRVPVVVALAAVWSCSGGSSPSATSSSSGGPGSDADGGSSGSSTSSSGGSSSGGSSSGNPCTSNCPPGTDAGTDAGPTIVPPVLSLLGVNQAGRSGNDVLVTITGSDPNKSAFGLDVALEDASGAPVEAFPTWSGPASHRIVLFDDTSAAGLATFTRTVTLPGFFKSFPNIAKVTATVVDMVGSSNAMSSTLTKQSLQNLAQACDPAIILSRCAAGLACDRTSSKCVHPAGPTLTKFAYVSTPAGGRMLFAGTDPADDLDKVHLDFMDNAGAPVFVDVTGNNDLVSSFDESVLGASLNGVFFYAIQSAGPFDQTVLQLGATPSGASGTGARLTAKLGAPVVSASGGTCDLRGFATCGPTESCVRSGAASTCVATGKARNDAKSAAAVLDPQGDVFATGYTTGTNLWGEPPSDCVPAGVHDMPAGIVVLHLAQPTPTVTLTTDNPETNARAAIFVLSGTGASVGAQPVGCSSGLPATLTLTNLQAGDYTVVLGATSATGGHYGVSVR